MTIGNDTGIGPAIRVLRHLTERQRVQQIRFSSGERALLLIAGMPAPSIELVRLGLGGFVPWKTVWKYDPTRAGGYSDYIHNLKTMFSAATSSDDSLSCIRDALQPCQSITEARNLLLEREWRANKSTREVSDGLPSYDLGSIIPDDRWEDSVLSSRNGAVAHTAKLTAMPDRYRTSDDARERILTCVEAPTVTVRAERGLVVPAKKARNYPAGTIFLDGVAQGDPFVDTRKELYNLDHHQGCIHSLATCEQAIVLIRKTVDFRKRDWLVLVNNAEVDTVLALWVLLNHLRLSNDVSVHGKIMPLLRLAGIIDAHGPEAQDLAAFPPDLLHSTSRTLAKLQQEEIATKRDGRWPEVDLPEYIAGRLRALDELIYTPAHFEDLYEIDELARAEISSGCVGVVCRSAAGMDEVERQLQKVYGERLGILILENAPSRYTVRQADRIIPGTLERAYERLNLLDPSVGSGSQNRWGASAQTGSSPRQTGTGLSPTQIIEAVQQAFRKPTVFNVVWEIPRAALKSVAVLLPALALILAGDLLRDQGYIAEYAVFLSALILCLTAGGYFCFKARRFPGLYGWRAPMGFGWLAALPAACVGAIIGGLWTPVSLGFWLGYHNLQSFTVGTALLYGLAAELLFRGVILGDLAYRFPLQKIAVPWLGSWPALISGILYAAASLLLFMTLSNGQLELIQGVLTAAGALTFGIASGTVRERSESIIPAVLLHMLGAAALSLFGN